MNQSFNRLTTTENTLDMSPIGPPPRLERSQNISSQSLYIAPIQSFVTPFQMPSPLEAPPQMEQRGGFQSPRSKVNDLDEVVRKLF